MQVPPLVLQTALSLAAILALVALARGLGLGGTPRLDGEEAVRRAAGEVEDGFLPVAFACDAEGRAALARADDGRIMVIRRHGNRFAGRVLGPRAQARLWRDPGPAALEVDPGEPRFGKVLLAIPDAEAWAAAIDRLGSAEDA